LKVNLILATPEHHISECAKICYATKSLEAGGKDITYNLIHGHSHLAALRFAYATVSIEGISIACQNQLVRSKHLDFMVQSKRYVNPEKGDFSFIMPENLTPVQQGMLTSAWEYNFGLYQDLVHLGMKKEDARSILPMNTSTKMNVTGNLQAWNDMFKLRLNPHAQTEIRTLANAIYDLLAVEYPNVFTPELKEKYSEA
jgi:thymidylate synthase (FAD)